MLIQIILSMGLLFSVFYVAGQSFLVSAFRISFYLITLMGIVAVWFPESTDKLAWFAGVGRGTDLLVYCWILLSLLLFVNFHIRLQQQNQFITCLIRQVALANQAAPPPRGDLESATIQDVSSAGESTDRCLERS